jgi:hypothetical protein
MWPHVSLRHARRRLTPRETGFFTQARRLLSVRGGALSGFALSRSGQRAYILVAK